MLPRCTVEGARFPPCTARPPIPPPLPCSAVGANNLSGKIPAAWSTLPLHSLEVSRNDGVCGEVPARVSSAVAGGDTGLNVTCAWDSDGAARARFGSIASALLNAARLSKFLQLGAASAR